MNFSVLKLNSIKRKLSWLFVIKFVNVQCEPPFTPLLARHTSDRQSNSDRNVLSSWWRLKCYFSRRVTITWKGIMYKDSMFWVDPNKINRGSCTPYLRLIDFGGLFAKLCFQRLSSRVFDRFDIFVLYVIQLFLEGFTLLETLNVNL